MTTAQLVTPAQPAIEATTAPARLFGFVRCMDINDIADDAPYLGEFKAHRMELSYEHTRLQGVNDRLTKVQPYSSADQAKETCRSCEGKGGPGIEGHPCHECFGEGQLPVGYVAPARFSTEIEVTDAQQFADNVYGVIVYQSLADLMAVEHGSQWDGHNCDMYALVEITGFAVEQDVPMWLTRSRSAAGIRVWRASQVEVKRAIYTEKPWEKLTRPEQLSAGHYWRGNWSGSRPSNADLFERMYGIRVDTIDADVFNIDKWKANQEAQRNVALAAIAGAIACIVAAALWIPLLPMLASLAIGALAAGNVLAVAGIVSRRLDRLPRIDRETFLEKWGAYALAQQNAPS